MRFDSFDAFVAYADGSVPRVWPPGGTRRSLKTGRAREAFTGTKDFAAAVALTRGGWPEGRKRLAGLVTDAAAIRQTRTAPGLWYDVAGAYPDPAMAAAGAPDCMVTPLDAADAARPVMRLVAGYGAHSGIPAATIGNFGAAVLSYIDAVEDGGVSVELILLHASTVRTYAQTTEVTAKRAGEPLETDRLAFMLLHPSMLRRLEFAVIERCVPARYAYSGYGAPNDARPDTLDHDQIFLGTVGDGVAFKTLDRAVAEMANRVDAERDRIAGS